MLAIQRKPNDAGRCTPNLLPCKVNYDGAVDAKERFWKPEQDQDEKHIAYFRGRKLHGREVKMPEGYEGSVLRITKNELPKELVERDEAEEDDDEEDDQESQDTKAVNELATFDKVIVWGHESIADATDDPYAKGIEEWVSFASAMHSQDGEDKSG